MESSHQALAVTSNRTGWYIVFYRTSRCFSMHLHCVGICAAWAFALRGHVVARDFTRTSVARDFTRTLGCIEERRRQKLLTGTSARKPESKTPLDSNLKGS